MSSINPSKRSLVRAAYVLLPSALLIGSGCSTIIGLGDYKVDTGSAGSNSAGTGVGGNTGSSGTVGTAGTSSGGKAGQGGINGQSGSVGEAGEGGDTGAGGVGEAGAGGAGDICPNNCDDGVACTVDDCLATGCRHLPAIAFCTPSTDPCIRVTCDVQQGCLNNDISTTVELLTNGNFDATAFTPWVPQSTAAPGTQMIIPGSTAGIGIAAQTPPNVARMGHVNDEYSLLYQPVTIPVGTVSMTISGYVQIVTMDTVSRADDAWIDFYDDPVNAPDTYNSVFFREFFNTDVAAGAGWQFYTEDSSPGSFTPGQRSYLAMHGFTNATLPTDFFFDSLSLKAKVCQQAAGD